MTTFISILASLSTFTSGLTYIRQLIKGESVPNPSTWCIWLIVTIINTVTYFVLVNKNIYAALSSVVLMSVIIVIFILSLSKGKFSKLGSLEIISLVLAVVIGVFWLKSGNATISNLSLQIIFLISFIPTIIGIKNKTLKERPAPWMFASLSYTLQILLLIIVGDFSYFAFAFPVINLLGNGIVGAMVMDKIKVEQ